jgi:hypothetical protein
MYTPKGSSVNVEATESATQIWVVIEGWYVVLLFVIIVSQKYIFKKSKLLWAVFCEYFNIMRNQLLLIISYFTAGYSGLSFNCWTEINNVLRILLIRVLFQCGSQLVLFYV